MYVPSHDGPGHDRAYVDPNKGGYSHYTNKGKTYRNDGNGNYIPVPQRRYFSEVPGRGLQTTDDNIPRLELACEWYDLACNSISGILDWFSGGDTSVGVCGSASAQVVGGAGIDVCIVETPEDGWGLLIRPHAGIGLGASAEGTFSSFESTARSFDELAGWDTYTNTATGVLGVVEGEIAVSDAGDISLSFGVGGGIEIGIPGGIASWEIGRGYTFVIPLE
ncbi:hypothetical protein [Stackebrandtia soli]|uniref:hypothetical protein n=1 Tax=Stackebrandtia soli TaxID=1892856 RepID=UPI0039E760FB